MLKINKLLRSSSGMFHIRNAARFITEPPNREIQNIIQDIFEKTLLPINKKVLGPLEKTEKSIISRPMVLIVGNHSSGKSTFINYLLQQNVQNTGVAPTDDGFTIISPTPNGPNKDFDGPSIVGNPDLGFNGLEYFGQGLLPHIYYKQRKHPSFPQILLVDSPGMIDTPAGGDSLFITRTRDRGYDFISVVRWFAERSDLILFFFDPDKPGTTGETLDCLTKSLHGLQHKLHIVMNKSDLFSKVLDYGRAYGALCWNLAKVFIQKDLPMIFTTCTPQSNESNYPLPQLIEDLNFSRKELEKEILSIEQRRDNNLITRLHYNTHLLKIHTVVVKKLKQINKKNTLNSYLPFLLTSTLGSGITTLLCYFQYIHPIFALSPLYTITSVLFTLGSSVGLYLYGKYSSKLKTNLLFTEESLDSIFHSSFYTEKAHGNEISYSLWPKVRQFIQLNIQPVTMKNLSLPRNIKDLDFILHEKIPELRRKTTGSTDHDITIN